jgi:hypothetical protein
MGQKTMKIKFRDAPASRILKIMFNRPLFLTASGLYYVLSGQHIFSASQRIQLEKAKNNLHVPKCVPCPSLGWDGMGWKGWAGKDGWNGWCIRNKMLLFDMTYQVGTGVPLSDLQAQPLHRSTVRIYQFIGLCWRVMHV